MSGIEDTPRRNNLMELFKKKKRNEKGRSVSWGIFSTGQSEQPSWKSYAVCLMQQRLRKRTRKNTTTNGIN